MNILKNPCRQFPSALPAERDLDSQCDAVLHAFRAGELSSLEPIRHWFAHAALIGDPGEFSLVLIRQWAWNAFANAALKREPRIFAALIAANFYEELRDDDYGMTPLHCAARWGFMEGAKLLLAHGADPLVRDFFGRSPLHYAASQGHVGVERILRAAEKTTQPRR